jgi:eukaryotic-like serine/threonine-protein kinase
MLDRGRLDQYEDVEVIGESGMATVYRAMDTETGSRVALKVPHLRLEGDVGFYERFRREEAIGLRLGHPGIVKFLRPRTKSRTYIVMEYVEGPTLRAQLREGTGLPVERAVDIARKLLETLVYLHGQKVVHGDLKPENIVLLPDGHLKLLDFGIAVDETSTSAGLSSAIGTPEYMAPEQIEGRRGDARADLYALGTILYEMLTGTLPHACSSTTALLRAKTRAATACVPPTRHAPGLDPRIEEIVLRALEPWPQNRYATARAMLEDLRDPSRVVPGEHPAPPPRAASRLRLVRTVAPFLLIGAIVSSPLLLTYLGGCGVRSSTPTIGTVVRAERRVPATGLER